MNAKGFAQRTTILLAEDEPDDVFLIRSAFTESGVPYQLSVVNDGDQAIQYLRGAGPYGDRTLHPMPFLLLLDLKMPVKSGFEVLEWVRGEAALDGLLVIVLSASALSTDSVHAKELGTNSYLVKSADYKQLLLFLKSLNPK